MTHPPEPERVQVGELTLAVRDSGGEGPAIVLVHGWPELSWSWKNQFAPLAAAGWRVIAPDLRGFGGSDAPQDKALYSIRHLTDDLAGLLDALGVERAVFCGHDWGGAIVWPMAQLHKDRVAGVIGVSTPHRPPPPIPPLEIIEKRFTQNHYFIRFQEEGAPERLFEGQEEKFFTLMFRRPPPRSDWPKLIPRAFDLMARFEHGPAPDPADCFLSDEDLAVYVEGYKTSGFHGGINLYRNVDVNYHLMKDVDPHIDCPALYVGAELDLFLPPEGAEGMEKRVPDLEKHVIPDCGHWVMWEKPAELNAILVDWLTRRFTA